MSQECIDRYAGIGFIAVLSAVKGIECGIVIVPVKPLGISPYAQQVGCRYETAGLIARSLENLWQGSGLVGQSRIVVVHAVFDWRETREHGEMARQRPGCRYKGISEYGSFVGELCQIWCGLARVAITLKMICAKRINGNE